MATSFIVNKKECITEAVEFFSNLFPPILDEEIGKIEIRTFKPAQQGFFSSKGAAVKGRMICVMKALVSISG